MYGTFVHCLALVEAANRPYINILYTNSLWSTDSQQIAFGCSPNIRRIAECSVTHLHWKMASFSHAAFRLCSGVNRALGHSHTTQPLCNLDWLWHFLLPTSNLSRRRPAHKSTSMPFGFDSGSEGCWAYNQLGSCLSPGDRGNCISRVWVVFLRRNFKETFGNKYCKNL